jgi:hypothetical protein
MKVYKLKTFDDREIWLTGNQHEKIKECLLSKKSDIISLPDGTTVKTSGVSGTAEEEISKIAFDNAPDYFRKSYALSHPKGLNDGGDNLAKVFLCENEYGEFVKESDMIASVSKYILSNYRKRGENLLQPALEKLYLIPKDGGFSISRIERNGVNLSELYNLTNEW